MEGRCKEYLTAPIPDVPGFTGSAFALQCERPMGHRGVHRFTQEITWSTV